MNPFWDFSDSRFLVCQAGSNPLEMDTVYTVTMFVTGDHGLLVHDVQLRSINADTLLGVNVPFLYFAKQCDMDDNKVELELQFGDRLLRNVLREFVGLERSDDTAKKAMLDFSFHLTVGNMDEAFKAIKLIKSESVWENMAQMCVKTGRLDVAAVCLGNMGHARGARAFRKVMASEAPNEVKVATLAVQLGMLDEAKALYISCGRHDLLNKLFQTTNNWSEAVEISQKNDRIHLRNTYYNYAGHLEANGSIENAIENYEKSDTHQFEIPRMLFDNPAVLENYVKKKRNPLGDMDGAKTYYESAGDYLSVVRIFCYCGNVDEAANVATSSNDKAACYHLARQYENEGKITSAVQFFEKALAFSSAIRLAREHNLEDKLAHLSLLAGQGDMLEAARFYENRSGHADKAVMLYHKLCGA